MLRRSTPIDGIIIITIILRTPGKASLEQNYNINYAAEGQYEQIINDNVVISAPYHDRQGKRTAGLGFVSIHKP